MCNRRPTFSKAPLYGWHGSQYMCHAAEVCTGRFCLRLLSEHSSQLLITQLLEHSSQLLIGPAHTDAEMSLAPTSQICAKTRKSKLLSLATSALTAETDIKAAMIMAEMGHFILGIIDDSLELTLM